MELQSTGVYHILGVYILDILEISGHTLIFQGFIEFVKIVTFWNRKVVLF